MLLTSEKQDFITSAQFFIGPRVDDAGAITLDADDARAGPLADLYPKMTSRIESGNCCATLVTTLPPRSFAIAVRCEAPIIK
jgi:hypothetical protein